MEPQDGFEATETRRRLAQELGDVRAAIALVAGGRATRVSLSGLRFGQELLAACGDEAARRGVVLEPSWWPEDAGCDIRVVRRPENVAP